ncbi:hypothetical protein AVEN_251380-1 [Araneus ventricosus]|uniref:Uncharacterized protein n=1 Tax=Araneus ventricosus TaxID=182803 RepID=A0A4Y2QZM2_ARAVE|nr:hypothetical protein AVEN_251380-1 [Araneus ventricosus]
MTSAAEHCSLALGRSHYERRMDYPQHTSVTIGKMGIVYSYCKAKKIKSQSPGMYCKKGKLKLCQIESPPDELLSYTLGDTSESKHFLNNIRRYNSSFQMTSFGAASIVEQSGFP